MTHQPITDAIYSRKGGGRKPRPEAPAKKKPREQRFAVAGALGSKRVDELYRKLGFKRPEQRRRKKQVPA